MEKNKRIFYLDILRVIACLAVVMIHSSAQYVLKDIGTLNFWIGNIFDGLSRIGVPLFIMISGALMLDKNYQFSTTKLVKHIKKMIIFFVFWSTVYCVRFNIIEQVFIKRGTIDIIDIIIVLLEGHYHLWFVYLIIGLYLIVPILRSWVNDKNKKYVEYFIILSIIFTYFISQIIDIGSNYSYLFEHLNDIVDNKLRLNYVGGYTTYFVLGWYVHNYDIKHKKIIYILGLLGIFITIMGTGILSVNAKKLILIYDNLYVNVLFTAIAIFVVVKDKFMNKKHKSNRIINSISKYSLGIYAIHALFCAFMYNIINKFDFNVALINIPAIFAVSFLLSYLCSIIISKIPILKKFI